MKKPELVNCCSQWWVNVLLSRKYSDIYTICIILSQIMIYWMLWQKAILCHVILCYALLYCTVPYYTVLYCTVLYCTVLYGTAGFHTFLQFEMFNYQCALETLNKKIWKITALILSVHPQFLKVRIVYNRKNFTDWKNTSVACYYPCSCFIVGGISCTRLSVHTGPITVTSTSTLDCFLAWWADHSRVCVISCHSLWSIV